MREIILSHEDFHDFPIGEFPYDRDHSAAGEYHYVTEKGYRGNWIDQVCNYTYNGTGPTWIITEYEGRHYMESMRIEKGRPHRMFPTLETGKRQWRDYEASVTIQRLSTKGLAGLVFCLNDTIDTLVFYLENRSRAAVAYRHKEEITILAEKEYVHNCDESYVLTVRCDGEKAECLVNGEIVCSVFGELVKRGGKAGITADCPTRFTDFYVSVSKETAIAIEAASAAKKALESQEMKRHPRMRLWKKIDLKNFGASRQIRFGHLTGTEEWYIVLAQMQKRVSRDAYGFISCLTAINLEGEILWQLGEASPDTNILGKVSADMPFQVYDIDGDGCDEVIAGRNFEIQILDGKTGNVRRAVKTPHSEEDDGEIIGLPYNTYAFDRLNPDGIRICNFSGNERPSDILIKDRYCRVYALNSDLKLLWKFVSDKNTGHCPMPVDINGDGRDEVLVGYTMLDSRGNRLWSYPMKEDHTDEIVAGKFRPGDENGYFACVSGTQGFFIGDFQGNVVARDLIGHAQRVSVANYCPDREGFELAVTNFWGHQGVIYLYDGDGKQIWEMENEMNGNILAPVNWDGNGAELILTNADPRKGGLLNGDGVCAVEFPDDGHPVMCCQEMDLTGDERDELVVWDCQRMYIYTQEDNLRPQTYHPVKFPAWNASNYRGEYSFPDRSYLNFKEK